MRASRRFLNRPIQTHQTDAAEPFFAPAQQTGVQAESEDSFFSQSAPQPPKGESASGTVQTKLTVNAPGDKHEQEADAMANQVVQRMSAPEEEKDKVHKKGKPEEEEKVQRMSAPEEEKDKVHKKGKPEEEEKVQRMSAPEEEKEKVHKKDKPEEEEPLQRKCAECEKEEGGQVQRQSDGSSTAPSGVTQQIESSKGRGSKLSDDTRTQMESSFGTDFSHVTIHTDHESTEMNNALHAQAFTHGSDIYFNEGKYNPQNTEGGRLLAHELTHVVQQGSAQSKNEKDEMKPGSVNNHKNQIQSKVSYKIQCDKIPHGSLTWADFKGDVPKKSSFDAETFSNYDNPDISTYPFKTLVETETGTSITEGEKTTDCTKGMDKDKKASEHPEKYKAFSVNIEPDISKLKAEAFMDQDLSWVRSYHKDMKVREAKAVSENVPKCTSNFTTGEKGCEDSASKSCKKLVSDCKKAFKKDISSFDIEGMNSATNAKECEDVLKPNCISKLKEDCIGSLTYSYENHNHVEASASKKSDCATTFKDSMVNTVMEDSSNSLLNHEQRHFDITNEIANQATNAITTLVASFDKEVTACSKEGAMAKAQKLITKQKSKIATELTTFKGKLSSFQKTYDSETNHSKNTKAQDWWGTNIDNNLADKSGKGKF